MRVGEVLRDPYVLEQFIGRGAQGECWLVREGQEQWLAKIYRLYREGWDPYVLVEREARILRQIQHPGIPAFRDLFLLPDTAQPGPTVCLIREWIPGQNLEAFMESKRSSETEVREIARQLLEILRYLHELSPSVIHRDIKPSNVILRPDQSIALIDFGSVRDAISHREGTSVVGTFGYTPPEQFLGHPTPASDLYALGATLLFLLARQHPSTLPLAHNRIQFESYINVQPRFLRILQRLLQPAVEERFRSAQEVLDALAHTPASAALVPLASPLSQTLQQVQNSVEEERQHAPAPELPAWQRNRTPHQSWSWERVTTPPRAEEPPYRPDLAPLIETLQTRHKLPTIDTLSDALEIVNAIDAHFGPTDETGRQTLLRMLHPYDAADILFAYYDPSLILDQHAASLMERFSLLLTQTPENAIGQWVLLYFLQKHGWVPQLLWRQNKSFSLPYAAPQMPGMPRRAARFLDRFSELPIAKRAKKYPQLLDQWRDVSQHFHLCCALRPHHLAMMIQDGFQAFRIHALPTYPADVQSLWETDRLLRWALQLMTLWPPHWLPLGPLLRRDAQKFQKLGTYIATTYKIYADLDQLRNHLQEEYHWLLPNGAQSLP